MNKTKDITLTSGEVVTSGELVRYVARNGGWHVGTLVKKVGKELVIQPGKTYAKRARRNIWVALSNVEKLPPKIVYAMQGLSAVSQAPTGLEPSNVEQQQW